MHEDRDPFWDLSVELVEANQHNKEISPNHLTHDVAEDINYLLLPSRVGEPCLPLHAFGG